MQRLKNNLSFLFISTAIITLIIMSISCNDNPVGPGNEPPPGRRDYTWTVDTLDAPNNFYFRMWASSPSDIWLVSSSNWDKSVVHYDGESWSYYGVNGMFPKSVYGFAENDIYVGSSGGGIWHYDGSTWTQIAKLTKDGHNNIVFDNMWGEASGDIYAFGAYPGEYGYNNSVIAHFKDGIWEILNTDGLYGIVEHLYKNNRDNNIYLQVVEIGGGRYIDSTHIYEYKQEQYNKLYSSVWTKGEQADISLLNDEVFFVLGNRIARRINDQFHTVVNVDNPNFYQRIWGRSSTDIFLLMTDGLVHYNGSNMEYLFHFNYPDAKPWTQIYGAALFEEDVFFLVVEPTTNSKFVYHGKLNK